LLTQQQQAHQAWSATKGAPTEAAADWTGAVVQSYGLAVFALPFAPLQHGREAFIPAGTEIQAVIDGDVTLQRADLEGLQPKGEEPRRGPGPVTFYSPTYAGNVRQSVWCGKAKIGELRKGGRFVVDLPEGTYWISLLNRRDVPWTKLDIQPGREQYIRVSASSVRTGITGKGWLPELTIVPYDVGELEATGTTTDKARHVIGVNDVDLALLQADPLEKKKKRK
jgi:hypothetical protein